MSGRPIPITPPTFGFSASPVAASTDSPAPSDTPARIGASVEPSAANETMVP